MKEYNRTESQETRQNLSLVLRNNDRFEIIAKCVDGDKISSAFVFAGDENHVEILQAFLDHGINVDVKDQISNTALIEASAYGHEESVRLLLNHNANPDIQNKSGWTALMHACWYENNGIVQLLLDHNADIDLKNSKGKTALDLAQTEQIKEMIQNHVNTSYVLK